MKKTIGGDRLGSGKKMQVDLRTYNRSTHDLGYLWKSSMASGTLVPFMKELMLPGDTFDVKLDTDIMTHPTVGPLFGSFKVQLDVFMCPIRLYNGKLHNNALGIGMDMASVKLPQIEIEMVRTLSSTTIEPHTNPSSILKYLGNDGIGIKGTLNEPYSRQFNAVPYLAYWDIYKNYYANKQEEIGAVLHTPTTEITKTISLFQYSGGGETLTNVLQYPSNLQQLQHGIADEEIVIEYTPTTEVPQLEYIYLTTTNGNFPIASMFNTIEEIQGIYTFSNPNTLISGFTKITGWAYADQLGAITTTPKVQTFTLGNIDIMRDDILVHTRNTAPYVINKNSNAPYSFPLQRDGTSASALFSQEGLALKTYNSDLFNNWMDTEWIEGTNGINEITAVDTSSGEFTIDTLILARKVYTMLNRIAISGGSYDDWLDAVYTHERVRQVESPVYQGGLIRELIFQQVINNSGTETEPLGELAGRGTLSGHKKGGNITIKADEPAYAIGIVSLTPRVDYSQGNDWDVNLKTLDDLHKPALDEIGFQDLITEQMASWSTGINSTTGDLVHRSAGKQPAWVNYMTNVNKTYGNFAIEDNEMFMTLNRRYETASGGLIKDLTTYIDPAKFNYIFAETKRDAQNFWVQIAVDITARRKMSAKIMPNL